MMPLQYADEPKQPGETLRYGLRYVPGKSIAEDDALTGTPLVNVYLLPTLEDKSSTMVVGGSIERIANTVYAKIQGGEDGQSYKITSRCGTVNGEVNVEEDLVIQVIAL